MHLVDNDKKCAVQCDSLVSPSFTSKFKWNLFRLCSYNIYIAFTRAGRGFSNIFWLSSDLFQVLASGFCIIFQQKLTSEALSNELLAKNWSQSTEKWPSSNFELSYKRPKMFKTTGSGGSGVERVPFFYSGGHEIEPRLWSLGCFLLNQLLVIGHSWD